MTPLDEAFNSPITAKPIQDAPNTTYFPLRGATSTTAYYNNSNFHLKRRLPTK